MPLTTRRRTSPLQSNPAARMRSRRLTAGVAFAMLALAGCGTTVPLSASNRALSGAPGLGLGSTNGQTGAGAAPTASSDGGGISAGTNAGSRGGVPGAVRGSNGPARAAATTGKQPGTPLAPTAGNKPVEVGFFVPKDLGPATRALGVSGLSTGNGANQAKVATQLINAGGGLGGHKVTPVTFQFDVEQNADSQQQAACSDFFEDNHVIAIVSAFVQPLIMACANQHRVPFVSGGSRSTSQQVFGQNPLMALSAQMAVERAASTLVSTLSREGFFTGSGPTAPKIGLIYNDDSDYSQVPQVVSAALQRLKLSLRDKVAMPTTDDTSKVSSASSSGQNAALRFKSEGINRVVVVDKNGQGVTYFGLAAKQDQYYPRLGLSSLSTPSLLPLVLSPQQLAGAEGVGWEPVWDVPLGAQPAGTARTRACLTAMSHAGEDMSTQATRASAFTVCDGAYLLAGAWRTSLLSDSSFVQGLSKLGRGFEPVITFRDDFSNRRDGVSVVRPLAYRNGCNCFAYSGGQQLAAS